MHGGTFDTQLQMLNRVVDLINISEEATQLAVLQYASYTFTEFVFKTHKVFFCICITYKLYLKNLRQKKHFEMEFKKSVINLVQRKPEKLLTKHISFSKTKVQDHEEKILLSDKLPLL